MDKKAPSIWSIGVITAPFSLIAEFPVKLFLDRNFLTVQNDLDKIIDVVRRKLYVIKV